ncbi:MAG: thiamine-phosphate kinase [Pseudomonadota bacterium]
MNEADLIDLLRPLAGPHAFNLEDDAAVLTPSPGQDLVLSKDTMVEGVHYPKGRIGGGFSERLLCTALSDLAAKGARPIGYMLSVAWPKDRDDIWLTGFVRGLQEAQASFDCPLIGGDTVSTDGPLVASATVFGVVPEGTAVLRSGAKVGDDVWYTGRLGLAEIGLAIVTGNPEAMRHPDAMDAEEAYMRPTPRFAFRKTLRRYATACADISDGIFKDGGHIAKASQVAIDFIADTVALATFGDDYELLFTASPEHRDYLLREAEVVGLPLMRCGVVKSGEGVSIDGNPVETTGYTHEL